MEIGTIGAGDFAQAFAKRALKAGHKVRLSTRAECGLPKCERKGMYAGIKELDFKSPVFHLTLLPDELIETGSRTSPLPSGAESTPELSPGTAPSNFTLKRTGLPFFVGPNTMCRSRAWNWNTILPGAAWRIALSPLDPSWPGIQSIRS